jgi:Protein of unknown function (DUF3017)
MKELRERAYRQAPMIAVLAIAAIGMQRVLTQHWREGAVVMAAGLLVAAVLRMVLAPERVGLLAIRSRPVDVLCYVGFGAAMAVLAATITRGSLTVS